MCCPFEQPLSEAAKRPEDVWQHVRLIIDPEVLAAPDRFGVTGEFPGDFE